MHNFNNQWIPILQHLASSLAPALTKPGSHVPCPVHGGKDGFRVFKDVNLSGGGICNSCGVFPNGFLLLQWVNGWSKQETITILNQINNGLCGTYSLSKPPNLTSPIVSYQSKPCISWQQIWQKSVALNHPQARPARDYLIKRGLSIPINNLNELRCHPALPYYEDGQFVTNFPALVALVRDVNGNPITVHRTYLTPSGDKAPVMQPKKLMSLALPGKTLGSAIRCFPLTQGKLAIAEGIETALAVNQLTKLPCWASVSANGLRYFDFPNGIKSLVIMADIDRSNTGQKAAQELAQRAFKQGFDATIHYPSYEHLLAFTKQSNTLPKSLDWLDVLNLEENYHEVTL
jgi:phage/plasmid primase-like uncharacterized protein